MTSGIPALAAELLIGALMCTIRLPLSILLHWDQSSHDRCAMCTETFPFFSLTLTKMKSLSKASLGLTDVYLKNS